LNPLGEFKGVRVIPSDLKLGKHYVEARTEYENLMGIRRR
jgi:hypothetical protein